MKHQRSDDDTESERPSKVPKLQTLLLDLPTELLSQVLRLISRSDACSLCSINKKHRKVLKPLVFLDVKSSWHHLIEAIDDGKTTNAEYVQNLRIIDSFSYGEWQIDLFENLKRFPILHSLAVNSCNSSNWLKYRLSNAVKRLTLYHEEDHRESDLYRMDQLQKSTKSSSTRPIAKQVVSTSPKIFSLFHLNGLANLNELLLHKYHFSWNSDEEISTGRLHTLHLVDCTWEYPFTLSRFNTLGLLQRIEITYHGHPFVLLERFAKFLDSPMQNANSSIVDFLIKLVDFHDASWRKVLLPRQLKRFAFENLRTLELLGFILNINSHTGYFEVVSSFDNLLELKLLIWDVGSARSREKFIEQVQNAGISLSITDEHE